jgi:3-oxoacyl-[acyl-carrier-protein] synthase II
VRRVAITGMGVIAPNGRSTHEFFDALIACRSGVGAVDIPDADRLSIRIAAQVRGFDAAAHFAKSRLSQLDRFSQFALVASRDAWTQAGFAGAAPSQACGVYFGTGFGGAATLETAYDDLFRKDANRVRPMSVVAAMPHAAAANAAIDLGIEGPCMTYSAACASSAVAIGEAYRAIASGALDSALAGGSEAFITFGVMKSWEALMALALEDKSAPSMSCRPFAADRTGLVLGEGAGALVLESFDAAKARGARILAEIVGYGISNDARTLSRPEAAGQVRAMRMALAEAQRNGVAMTDVGYLNAHGTGTKVGDRIETDSIKLLFGELAHTVPVSSTKALHGHLMGAGGAVELIAAVLAMERRIIPPTAHLAVPDPECDLDYVANVARPAPHLRAVMSNSFAFGGTNVTLVARRAD